MRSGICIAHMHRRPAKPCDRAPQEAGAHGNQQHELFYAARDAQGRPLGTFDYLARLLVPLCAARAAEEVLYGPDGTTLSTASEVTKSLHAAPPWAGPDPTPLL